MRYRAPLITTLQVYSFPKFMALALPVYVEGGDRRREDRTKEAPAAARATWRPWPRRRSIHQEESDIHFRIRFVNAKFRQEIVHYM